MKAPPGFSEEYNSGEGCKLKNALYGLKQSPRAWFERFTTAMKKFGYEQSNSDNTVSQEEKGSNRMLDYFY